MHTPDIVKVQACMRSNGWSTAWLPITGIGDQISAQICPDHISNCGLDDLPQHKVLTQEFLSFEPERII